MKRHRLLGPWSRATLLFQAIYLSITVLCLSYNVSDLSEAGSRAGTLSLINMIPLYSGLHLSFLVDMYGISVQTYTKLHGSIGVMAGALASFHTGVALASTKGYTTRSELQLYGFIVRCHVDNKTT